MSQLNSQGGGIIVVPQGLVATLTVSRASGAALTLYTDAACTSSVTQPVAVSSETTYYVDSDDSYVISLLTPDGTEWAAGVAGNTKTVEIRNGHITTVSLPRETQQHLSTTFLPLGATHTPEMHGAVGDGITDDHVALQAMFDAVPDKGVIRFTPGKTYATSAHHTLNGKSVTVIAWGATIIMLDGASADSYTFLAVNRVGVSFIDYFRWYGGTIDGNGFNQSYVGSAWSGSDNLDHNTLGNTGLVGVQRAKDALAVGVRVRRSVSEGICFVACNFAKFLNCHGEGGVPAYGGAGGLQGTYFKTRYDPSVVDAVGIWEGCTANTGSIAFHASSPTPVVAGSTAIFIGCTTLDMTQDAFHVEHAEKVIVHGCQAKATSGSFVAQIQISNATKWFSIDGCHVEGGNIWASNVSGVLEQGSVSNTRVIDTATSAGASNYAIDIGVGGIVTGCTVSSTIHGGVSAETVTDCKVLSVVASSRMISSAKRVRGCDLGDVANGVAVDYTVTGIGNFQGGNITGVRAYGLARLLGLGASATSRTYVTDCEAINMGSNAVTIDGGALVKIRGGVFRNTGADNTLTNPLRAAIGGSSATLGAVCTQLEVRHVNIENDGAVGTAYTQPLWFNNAAGKTIIWDVIGLVGMTTANTLATGGGTSVMSTTASRFARALAYSDWTFPLQLASSQAATTVGTVYATGHYIAPGEIVNNIFFGIAVAAAGTAPGTGISYGIANSAGKILAQTNPSTAFTSLGAKSLALTSAYQANNTDSPTGLYYFVILEPIAWGTTQPQFLRTAGSAAAIANGGNPLPYGTGATLTQSALPANGSNIVGGIVGSNALGFWAAWN